MAGVGAATMRFTVSKCIAAPPGSAWELLAATGTWTRWGPSVTAVEPADSDLSEGLTGRVRTAIGIWLPFRITQLEESRSWSWSVVGIPATSHHVDAIPGGCRVTFGVPFLGFPYLLICQLALGRIARELEAADSHDPGLP